MDGEFDIWNKQKKIINRQYQKIFFKERDVFLLLCEKTLDLNKMESDLILPDR